MKKLHVTKKQIGYTVFCLLLAFLLYVAANINLICSYAWETDVKEADCAIILGAGMGEYGPSPVFRERINHGIELYRAGQVRYLIFTGGIGEGTALSDAEVAKQYAREWGVPEDAILIEKQSRYTHENLQYAKALMDENGLQTALIVSDPLHMKRAMLVAEDVGIECYSSPTPTSKYQSVETKADFLFRETACYIGYNIYRIFAL